MILTRRHRFQVAALAVLAAALSWMAALPAGGSPLGRATAGSLLSGCGGDISAAPRRFQIHGPRFRPASSIPTVSMR